MAEKAQVTEQTEEVVDDDPQARFAAALNKQAEEATSTPPAEGGQQEANQEPEKIENESPSEESEEAPAEQPTIEEMLSQHSDGRVKNVETLKALLAEVEELKKPKEPVWKNDRQKLVYEYATRFEGNEVQAMQRYLDVQSIDVEKLSAKETLFQEFRLNPENADLTSEEARKIFDLDYKNRYEAMEDEEDENSILIKRQHDKEVRKAKDSLVKMKEEFTKAGEQTPEPEKEPEGPSKEVVESVEKAMRDFKGVDFRFDKDDEPFSLKLEKNELEAIKNDILDPTKMFNEALSKMVDKEGNLDLATYRDRLALVKKVLHEGPESVLKGVYNHAKLQTEARLKNIEKPDPAAVDDGGNKTFIEKVAASIDKAKAEQGWR